MADYNSYPDEKKVWGFVQITPCFHKEGHVWALQELQSVFVDGVREEPELPKSTRVVYMKMNEDGSLVNVHSKGRFPRR